MNYYPYFNGIPYMAATSSAKTGIFKSLFGGLNLSSIINGTQKALGIVNQAIPLIKQAKPVLNNAKTMFKVMNEFKKAETPISNDITVSNQNKEAIQQTIETKTPSYQNNGPVFFQ